MALFYLRFRPPNSSSSSITRSQEVRRRPMVRAAVGLICGTCAAPRFAKGPNLRIFMAFAGFALRDFEAESRPFESVRAHY